MSPLFAAAQEGHLEAVRLLVEAGANLDEDTNRSTKRTRIEVYLVAANVIIALFNDQLISLGQTPLFAASANGHHAVVRFLIRNSR